MEKIEPNEILTYYGEVDIIKDFSANFPRTFRELSRKNKSMCMITCLLYVYYISPSRKLFRELT